jgi:hypothetical protein
MYLTYPIPIQLLDQKINDFLDSYDNHTQFDFNLNEEERMNVYSFYSLAFAKIAKINTYFSSLIKLIDDCIKKGEVIALIPLKGYTKIELLYAGTPTIFIIIYPFVEERYSITEKELLTITMELLYQIFYIQHVMEANSEAYSLGKAYINLEDPFVELYFQKLRLTTFKDFWKSHWQEFNGFRLPPNLETLIN